MKLIVDSNLTDKLDRLARGCPPRVLDVCSGCGGLSLGLQTAGFRLSAHIEADPVAAATFSRNLAPKSPHGGAWAMPRDMGNCSVDGLVSDFALAEAPSAAFDVLAAGLPCQAFARIGRSKLRAVAGDKQAFKRDPRARLYRRFLELVDATKPLAILLENVPDIVNFGGRNVPEEISRALAGMGFDTRYTLLNAAFYGVPQLRERLFLIAIHRSLGVTPSFPSPTHYFDLPSGYHGSRRVALKCVPGTGSHFTSILEPSRELPQAVSVMSALADLPRILEHLDADPRLRGRRVADRLPYRQVHELSDYARIMRSWPGFETEGMTDGHVVRMTPRDYPIFQRMPHGSDYPVAVAIAEALLIEKLRSLPRGRRSERGYLASHRELRRRTVPPYSLGKFPNRWWKLNPRCPSRTLTAHMGKDTYTHIHYDSRQQRTISVREAARLQAFPDGFRFSGAMNAAFRQIGNAVPPLLALAVARSLLETLYVAAGCRTCANEREQLGGS